MQDDVNHAMTSAQIAISRMDAHESICTERYNRIQADTTDIKETLRDIGRKLEGSIQRVHDRLDAEVASARTAREGISAEARSNSNLALTAAQKASDDVKDSKIWILSTAAGSAGGIVLWLIQLVWGKH